MYIIKALFSHSSIVSSKYLGPERWCLLGVILIDLHIVTVSI